MGRLVRSLKNKPAPAAAVPDGLVLEVLVEETEHGAVTTVHARHASGLHRRTQVPAGRKLDVIAWLGDPHAEGRLYFPPASEAAE